MASLLADIRKLYARLFNLYLCAKKRALGPPASRRRNAIEDDANGWRSREATAKVAELAFKSA
jgi:hypothetical protein